MVRQVEVNKLSFEAVDLWLNQWLLLTAGTLEDCNMMTVSWGTVGCMWGKAVAQIVVRPQRHTRRYLEQGETFTLCAFPEQYRPDLQLLGSLSGKAGPKLGKTRLTLKAAQAVASPVYHQASFILECRKLYWQDLDPQGFLDQGLQEHYPSGDYHRIYYGEILAAFCA